MDMDFVFECWMCFPPDAVYSFKMAQIPASVGPTGRFTVELALDDGQSLAAVRPPIWIKMHMVWL